MSSNTAWDNPAILLLLAVVAANLLLPLAHFWPSGSPTERSAGAGSAPRPAELSGTRVAPVVPPDLAKRVSLPLRKPTPVCRAWGPFTALGDAEALARQLGLPGEDFEVFQSEVEASPDYLVTVRAPGSRDAAERVLEELNGRGVDSYALDRGGDTHVLAAGVFSAPGRADAQRQRLAGLGYDAVIEPLQRSHRVYHLLARLPAAAEPEIPPLGACSDIAPLEQFL